MKRGVVLAGVLAAGCAPQGETPADGNVATPAVAAPPKAATAGPVALGSELRGDTSALAGDISGLSTRETAFGTVVELPTDTLFAFDSATLSPAAETNLAKAAELIRQAPPGPIAVTGHTDAKGEDAYNLKLSRSRAEAVAAYMRDQIGIRQRTYTVEGKGETAPVAPNTKANGADDPEGRARNRRVELLLPKAG